MRKGGEQKSKRKSVSVRLDARSAGPSWVEAAYWSRGLDKLALVEKREPWYRRLWAQLWGAAET